MSDGASVTGRTGHVQPGGASPRSPDGPGRALLSTLAVAGLVGSVGFLAVTAALGLARPGYSFVAAPVVALTDGPGGWAQHLNLALLGVLVMVFAVGLHLGIRPARWGAAGPAVLALGAVGPVLAGVTGPVPPHFLLTFACAVLGFALLSYRMARDPRWRSLAGYALATAIALAVVVPIHSALALPEDGPLHAWWGLLNWAALALWLVCVALLATRLLRVARVDT